MRTILRGRDSELAAIGERIADARIGRGAVVLVEGEAGSGKTSLLDEACAMARRASLGVASATATAQHALRPTGLLLQALAGLVGPVSAAELQAELERATQASPTLICLDDVQWADRGSLAAVATLARRLAGLPIVWLLAARTPFPEPLRDLAAAQFTLHRLGPAELSQVVTDVLGGTPDRAVLELAARSDGHPYLLAELLAGLEEERLLDRTGAGIALVSPRLPARFGTGMQMRLASMPAGIRTVAQTAAILGGEIDAAAIASITRLEPREVEAALERLVQLALLSPDRGFRHELLREALVATLAPEQALRLNRRAVDVLLERGADVVDVAPRLAASAEPGDAAATALLLAAARSLGTSDPHSAADLGLRGFALAFQDDPSRGALAAETALHLHAAGRPQEAREFARSTLGEVLDTEQQAEVLLSIAWMFGASLDDQVEAGEQALALPGVSAALRARHLARLTLSLTISGRTAEAERRLAELDTPALDFERTVATIGVEIARGRLQSALVQVEAAERAAGDDPMQRSLWTHWRADLFLLLDRHDEALALAEAGATQAREGKRDWEATLWEQRRGRALVECGRTIEAIATLEDCWINGDAVQAASGADVVALAALGTAALRAGDLEQRRRVVTHARSVLALGAPESRNVAACVLLVQALADEDHDGVRRAAALLLAPTELDRGAPPAVLAVAADPGDVGDRGAPPAVLAVAADPGDVGDRGAPPAVLAVAADPGDVGDRGAPPLDPRAPVGALALPTMPPPIALTPTLVRGALLVGRRDLAEAAVAWHANLAAQNPGVASIDGTLAHARGLLDQDPHQVQLAIAHLEASPQPLLLASALEDAGRSAPRDEAIDAFEKALAAYTRAEASWDARRVRRRLRALGVNRPAAAQEPGSAMTAAETEVVRLIAAGATNREVAARLFVSPHTVNTHVRHVFAKLGISSRMELVNAINQTPGPEWATLTPSERRVARLVAEGLSSQAVADVLHVSPHTVNSHLRRIYKKLGIRSRSELARSSDK